MRAAKGLPPLPAPDPVSIYDDLRWAWNGFWRLSNARPQGFAGPGRIPFAEIKAYAELYGYDLVKRQDFLYFIERLDDKFMEIAKKLQEEEERKQQQQQNGKGNKSRPSR